MSLQAVHPRLATVYGGNLLPKVLATTSSTNIASTATNTQHRIPQQQQQAFASTYALGSNNYKSLKSYQELYGLQPCRLYSVPAATETKQQLARGGVAKTINDVKVVNGLPQITLPLPSRNEKCVFSLKPVSHNVGDFVDMLKFEDKGIDSVFIKNTDGIRIASKTSIQTLFDQDFDIYMNDNVYRVSPPAIETLSGEELKKISDVKYLISQLYDALNIQDFHVEKEAQLVKELEDLKKELKPLENQKQELEEWAEKRTSLISWAGLGLMSVQFGVLARLTWWEYSWDIMEPVTYFVTYGTAMAAYAYFVLTKEEYMFNDAAKRTWLMSFHKKADKHRWDVEKYNKLRQGIINVEADLRRLRMPIQTASKPKYLQEDGKSAGIFGINNLKDVLNKIQ
eukprot:TRINITY_DN16358_c0_g1_i11.p1 TRINITY_DN16358_c0_g1~~TRINITY_DN16358_c0_g1_i11.p1  ORF type:complete len:397 (-),score=122.60 TRINITY_DN16358_c0_g1_i11:873-2063(-)